VTAPLDIDLAIIGSGFGGSLLGMVARRLGLRVALIERGTHPRFAIGESASPLAGVVIEQLARRYDLPRLAPLASYGAWRRHYPHLACGLKRGFTYFNHHAGRRFEQRDDRANQLLVAASPADELSDTHWFRADVDQFLMNEAVAAGAVYVDELQLDSVEVLTDRVLLSGHRRGGRRSFSARFVVDASGPRGVLSRAFDLEVPTPDGYPQAQALYSHFTDVGRCAELPEFAADEEGPYPIDAAALHHVFDGGWMWVLRFDNGVTSAGVAVTDALAAELRLADGEPAWTRLLQRYPSVAAQFADARPIREFTWLPRLAWRTSRVAGERWALLPSAAAFVDPLFSTGIPLTLLGIERVARNLALKMGSEVIYRGQSGGRQDPTLAEADHVAGFIAGCYAAFPRFDQFAAWSMFYFAAASFSEMSRRLHGDAWSRGFLSCEDDRLVNAMAALSPARGGTPDMDAVAAAIEPINVAGLADREKRNWYRVDVEDAVRAAHRLHAPPDAIRALYAGLSTKSNSAVTYGG
jgi:FADH2 O2-dependent halogenase